MYASTALGVTATPYGHAWSSSWSRVRAWSGWRSRHSSSEYSRGLSSTGRPLTHPAADSSRAMGPTSSIGPARREPGAPRRPSARSRAESSANANGLTR